MRRSLRSFSLVILMGITSETSAYVGLCCGKCGGNMPLNILGSGVPETHEFRVKLSPMYMQMEGLREGTDRVNTTDRLGMPTMGKFMAAPEDMEMSMLNLSVGYSFADDFFAGAMFMYKRNRMTMRFNQPMQTMTGSDGFTMESDGLGDLMLMSKYRLYTDDPLIPTKQSSLFFGLSVPTGSIDEKNDNHPLAMRRNEQLPYGMQLGSGTYDPTIGILYGASSSPHWWGTNLSYTTRIGENSRDYALGDEWRADVYYMRQFRYDLVGELQLNGRKWSEIEGEMDESKTGASGHAVQGNPNSPFMTPLWNPNNYGGTELFLTAGLQWQPVPLHIINLQVGIPLYRDLDGLQLEKDYTIMLMWYMELPTKKSLRHGTSNKGKLGF